MHFLFFNLKTLGAREMPCLKDTQTHVKGTIRAVGRENFNISSNQPLERVTCYDYSLSQILSWQVNVMCDSHKYHPRALTNAYECVQDRSC
jgi:hypothetical protein